MNDITNNQQAVATPSTPSTPPGPAPAAAPSPPGPSGRSAYGGRASGGGKPGWRGKGGGGGRGAGRSFRRKVCRFCAGQADVIDYKNVVLLRNYITERGKIIQAKVTGNCSRHQRDLTHAIKRARNLALIPYSTLV